MKVIFKNLFIEGQEWCYLDKLAIEWDLCARGDFKIESSVLMKNINFEKNLKKEFCIFSFIENNSNVLQKNQIYSANCDIMLKIKKYKLDKILDISKFEFFWMNGAQIKTKEEKCFHPVETPIIKNNKISYFGYIETKQCKINDDLTINNEQKWKIDENGRIINEFSKKCLVRSQENKNFFSFFDNFLSNFILKKKDFEQINIYNVNLGDCIGNSKGYQGREIFLLEEFKPELLEFMALEKLVKVYKKEEINLNKIFTKSNEELLRLISYNTQLIDSKQIIDNTETKLESAEKSIEKLNVEQKLDNEIEKKKNFNFHGLMMQIIPYNDNLDIIDFEQSFFVENVNIDNSLVQIYNKLNLFDDNPRKLQKYSYQIPEKNIEFVKFSGFLINNSKSDFKLKIESNCLFIIIINSKVIYMQSVQSSGIINTESFKLMKKSANQIEIQIVNQKNLKFNLSLTKDNKIVELSLFDFIPIEPFKEICYNKKDILTDSMEHLTCNRRIKTIDISKNDKTYYCSSNCIEKTIKDITINEDESNFQICQEAYIQGKTTQSGGLIYFSDIDLEKQSRNKLILNSFNYNYIIINNLIQEVKLGYYEDFNKYTKEASESLFKNYILKQRIMILQTIVSFFIKKVL